MSFDDQRKKAFDFAQEVSKQLITLSTAVITVTLTFQKDFVTEGAENPRYLVMWSWYFLLASIVFGVLTLMALTGSLEPKTGNATPSTRTPNVIFPAVIQIVCFVIGMLAAIIFGVSAK